MYNLGADVDPVFTLCTFSRNHASGGTTGGGGGGMFNLSSDPVVRSSILWGNSDVDGVDETAQIDGATASPAVTFSCLEGWTGSLGGTGNIGLDPRLVDADGDDDVIGTDDDDLRLRIDSPCLDAGDGLSVPTDSFDLDGDGDASETLPVDLGGLARLVDDPTADTGAGPTPIVDMGPHERGPFCQPDLGFQGPGNVTLSVCGHDLTQTGNVGELVIENAAPAAPLLLFVGLQADPVPLAGGTFVPFPPLLVIVLQADPNGALAFPVPGAGGPALTLVLQVIAQNGAAAELSNAVAVTIGT